MAMAWASNIPMMIGSLRFPSVSPNTKAKEPVCDWLEESPNISSLIFFKVFRCAKTEIKINIYKSILFKNEAAIIPKGQI